MHRVFKYCTFEMACRQRHISAAAFYYCKRQLDAGILNENHTDADRRCIFPNSIRVRCQSNCVHEVSKMNTCKTAITNQSRPEFIEKSYLTIYCLASAWVAWFSTYPLFDNFLALAVVLTARWCLYDGVFSGTGLKFSSNNSRFPKALMPAFTAALLSRIVGGGRTHGVGDSSASSRYVITLSNRVSCSHSPFIGQSISAIKFRNPASSRGLSTVSLSAVNSSMSFVIMAFDAYTMMSTTRIKATALQLKHFC